MDLTAGTQKPCPHLFAYIVEAFLTTNSVGAIVKVPVRYLEEVCRAAVEMGPQVDGFGTNQGIFVYEISNLTGKMEEGDMRKFRRQSHGEIYSTGAKDVGSVRKFLKVKEGKLREMAERQESRTTVNNAMKLGSGTLKKTWRIFVWVCLETQRLLRVAISTVKT